MSVCPITVPLDVYEAKHLHVCSNVFSNDLTTCCSATSLQMGIAPSWWAVVFDLCGLFPTLLSVTKSKEHCLEGKHWALITGCCNRRQVVAAVGEVMIANGSIKGAKQRGKKRNKKIFDHMKTREVTVQKKTIDATNTQTVHMAG